MKFRYFAIIALLLSVFTSNAYAANLTSIKDTLQTSRISINARVDGTVGVGSTAGGSRVLIKTSAVAPANTITTDGLKYGDIVYIGAGTSYTVTGIPNSTSFSVTPVLSATSATDGTNIYLKSKPRHVVSFTTVTAVPNGYFQILLPADIGVGVSTNDTNPDATGFDFNTSVDVVGANASGYTFTTGTATASGGTNCLSPSNYHCFEVRYTGLGSIGVGISVTIGNTTGTNTPIAPSADATHAVGTADDYTFIVKNYSTSNVAIDSTQGKIGLIESVRVTATVDPRIDFTISGVGVGVSSCTVPNTITTTAASVPFGTLSLNTFATGAQQLGVSTNATNGYSVTAVSNGVLTSVGVGSTIPNTTCDTGACTTTVGVGWTSPTIYGFGYSLSLGVGATAPFVAGSGFTTRQFDSSTPREVMSSTTISDAHTVNVCYRVAVGSTQAAGDYENQITYTATATF